MTNLIEDIDSGKTSFGIPDKVIETMISKIFFFGDKVVKVYKWRKEFFGDLSDPVFRKTFIPEDFFWNNTMSPEIYTELLSLKKMDEKWEKTDSKKADDFCIVMNKLFGTKTLIDLAESKQLKPEILGKIAEDIIYKQRKITEGRKEELATMLNRKPKEMERDDLEDLREWNYIAAEYIPKEKADYIVDKLLSVIETKEYVSWAEKMKVSARIDGNGDNIVIDDTGNFRFIDVLAPKINWRTEDESFNLSRIAADVAVFMGPEATEIIYKTFTKITGLKVPEIIKKFYEARCAMIQAPYRFILKQPDRAQKYLNFVEKQIASF